MATMQAETGGRDELDELDRLSAAILELLAEASGAPVSLPRLTKRLGVGASVLMRQLTLMGRATIGGVAGPHWVQVTQQLDGRWFASLTEPGRLRIAGHRDLKAVDATL